MGGTCFCPGMLSSFTHTHTGWMEPLSPPAGRDWRAASQRNTLGIANYYFILTIVTTATRRRTRFPPTALREFGARVLRRSPTFFSCRAGNHVLIPVKICSASSLSRPHTIPLHPCDFCNKNTQHLRVHVIS